MRGAQPAAVEAVGVSPAPQSSTASAQLSTTPTRPYSQAGACADSDPGEAAGPTADDQHNHHICLWADTRARTLEPSLIFVHTFADSFDSCTPAHTSACAALALWTYAWTSQRWEQSRDTERERTPTQDDGRPTERQGRMRRSLFFAGMDVDGDGVDLTEFSGAINVFEIWRNKKTRTQISICCYSLLMHHIRIGLLG